MTFPQTLSRRARQFTSSGDLQATGELDAGTTTETVTLSTPSSKITVQSTGDLAGNVEFSLNGVDFEDSAAFTDGAMLTYTDHIVKHVRVTRTGGAGRLVIAAE